MQRESIHQLLDRFKNLYPDCEPLAFQLDGFTHSVYFIDKKDLKVKREQTSAYMSECERSLYNDMPLRCKNLFEGYPHYAFQNNAQEVVIHQPEEIEALMDQYYKNNNINNSIIYNKSIQL